MLVQPTTSRPTGLRLRVARAAIPIPILIGLGLGLGLVSLTACGGQPPAPVPPGTTWTGDAARILPLLERLEALSGTPVAAAAVTLRSAVEGCDQLYAHCPAGDPECSLPARARCGGPEPGGPESPARLAELRGAADWVFTWGSPEGHGLILRGTGTPDGGLALDGEVYAPHEDGNEGPASLLLPSAEPPGPARMSSAGALIHARFRPDGGLNVARFIEGGDWSARLYRLQSELFEGSTLAGVWELGVYTPRAGELIPPLALALDIKRRELAVEGMETFLADLQETWPVRRSDFRLRGLDGACLSNVRVMPDLAPCYVASDDTLLVGWNPRSLELALADAGEPPWEPESSAARVYLDRLPRADAVVAETSGAFAPVPPEFYPWRRIELRGARARDHYRLEAELSPQ
ncbi:MAG: hypothetical protein PVG07_01255 [Acidobacteriota bacterium]|jgi:hypothetical protein